MAKPEKVPQDNNSDKDKIDTVVDFIKEVVDKIEQDKVDESVKSDIDKIKDITDKVDKLLDNRQKQIDALVATTTKLKEAFNFNKKYFDDLASVSKIPTDLHLRRYHNVPVTFEFICNDNVVTTHKVIITIETNIVALRAIVRDELKGFDIPNTSITIDRTLSVMAYNYEGEMYISRFIDTRSLLTFLYRKDKDNDLFAHITKSRNNE